VNEMSPSVGKSLAEIIASRQEKLAKIRAMGINPFPYSYDRTHTCLEAANQFDQLKETVTIRIAGRIMSIRRMGRASFFHIQDQSGRLQLYIQENKVGHQGYELSHLLDIGDYIGIQGALFITKTGEITLFVETLTLLAKNIRPIPIVKEKDGEVFDAFSDKEQRYRQRHLDMVVNPNIREVFVKRSRIIQLTREFLNGKGFLEVETPILQPIYGGASARPFKTFYNALDRDFYLRIADELYLKRLIIGGLEKVYEIAKNFRNEGIDKNHNPEFTLLEFYQTYVDYHFMMNFVEEYFRFIADRFGQFQLPFNDHTIDLSQPFRRCRMYDLIREYGGVDIRTLSTDELIALCRRNDLEVKPHLSHGKLIELLFGHWVEPHLIQPTFVTDFPKAISPLAKLHRDGSTDIVERFELFIGSQEFANAFSELNDPIDQRERLVNQSRLRDLGDEEAQTFDEDFIQAMEYGMPPTGGVGIGIDRVVMLFTNQHSIKDVLLFPQLRS